MPLKRKKEKVVKPEEEEGRVEEEEEDQRKGSSVDVTDLEKYIENYNSWQLLLAKNDRQNTLQHSHTELSQPIYYPAPDPELATARTQLEKQRIEAKLLRMEQMEEKTTLGNLASRVSHKGLAYGDERRNSAGSSLLALSETSGMSAQMEVESTAKKQLFEHLLSQIKLGTAAGDVSSTHAKNLSSAPAKDGSNKPTKNSPSTADKVKSSESAKDVDLPSELAQNVSNTSANNKPRTLIAKDAPGAPA